MLRPIRSTEIIPRSSNLLARFQEDIDRMERMFERSWPTALPSWSIPGEILAGSLVMPAIDVYEEGNDVIATMEIPGVRKDDIKVDLTGSTLTVSGQKERKEETRDEQYYRSERSYGSFSRSVELPGEVRTNEAQATFRDGVLEIRVPKTEESKRKSVKLKIS